MKLNFEGERCGQSTAAHTMSSADPMGRVFAGLSVLVVDDIPDNQMLVAWIMESLGGHVVCAGNGEEAIRCATDQKFDLIIMDLQMPVCSGFQATAALRALGFDRPILAISAGALQEVADKAFAVGCDEFLVKPYELSALTGAVRRLAGR